MENLHFASTLHDTQVFFNVQNKNRFSQSPAIAEALQKAFFKFPITVTKSIEIEKNYVLKMELQVKFDTEEKVGVKRKWREQTITVAMPKFIEQVEELKVTNGSAKLNTAAHAITWK